MAESNYDGVEVRIKNCSRDRDNYDRLLSVFHTGTEVKRCLLEHFLRGKKINLFDWLTNLDENFLQFEDVQRAVRRSAVIQVTDLESSTINTLLKNNCFLMFWNICLQNNKLEDILNSHKAVLSSIYENAGINQTFSSLSTEYYKPRLTTTQWKLLFKTDDQSEINRERNCHSISASKDITLSSLDNELNFVLLYTICPLFKSVDVVSECQIQITKIAVFKSELQKPAFDEIWDKIKAHIQMIGGQCNLSEYFKHKCDTIQQTIFNRTVSQESRKCILEDAFKIPDFIKDNTFCYCVRTELDNMIYEDNLNLSRTLCGREIPIVLVKAKYTKGAYALGVLEQADKDKDIRASFFSNQDGRE
ncbi:uncharacterized protein LOC127718736 [Mytilus californianus]|uniref:uncharacterized protein LOC127718736 n=1 Tax=Mytilus californianus TaxID=6549 RepID=UPI002247E943|nr:uncharacterized protein LOC127718736 [Mytilus californianus]